MSSNSNTNRRRNLKVLINLFGSFAHHYIFCSMPEFAIEAPVLYGIGTMEEIRKKMTGKYIIKQTDLPAEMRAEVADAIQTGFESYAAQPNVIEVALPNNLSSLQSLLRNSWTSDMDQHGNVLLARASPMTSQSNQEPTSTCSTTDFSGA